MSDLPQRESAAVWLFAVPIMAIGLLLLHRFRFDVMQAFKDPIFWLYMAGCVWYFKRLRRRALSDHRWPVYPSHENPRR